MMLLAFQEAITRLWQSFYEGRVPYEAKRGAADTEFGSMTFDELWTLDSILQTFNLSCILLSTLIAFQNAKALLI